MRRLGLLLILAVALIAALWRWQPATEGASTTTGTPGSQPGYVATGAELVDTGEDGQPQFRLQANRISQQRPGAVVELDEPRIEYQGSTR